MHNPQTPSRTETEKETILRKVSDYVDSLIADRENITADEISGALKVLNFLEKLMRDK